MENKIISTIEQTLIDEGYINLKFTILNLSFLFE